MLFFVFFTSPRPLLKCFAKFVSVLCVLDVKQYTNCVTTIKVVDKVSPALKVLVFSEILSQHIYCQLFHGGLHIVIYSTLKD